MYEYRCKIIRVIDGDTVDVDIDLGFDIIFSNQRIRLYGIDTPESRTSDEVEKRYGVQSKEFLKSYLHEGEYATLQTVKDSVGKFGRVLGKFLVVDRSTQEVRTVNDLLIENHYAVPYFGQSKQNIIEGHLANREILLAIAMSSVRIP